jgi:hypothetical protein
MTHIAFDGFEKIGDQVGAALELHVDPGPAFLHQLPLLDQIVVQEDGIAGDGDDDRQDDQASHLWVSSDDASPSGQARDWHCRSGSSTGRTGVNGG